MGEMMIILKSHPAHRRMEAVACRSGVMERAWAVDLPHVSADVPRQDLRRGSLGVTPSVERKPFRELLLDCIDEVLPGFSVRNVLRPHTSTSNTVST